MSQAAALEFIARVDTDLELSKQIGALDPTDGTSLISIARDAGYQICVADFKAAAQALGRDAGDLTDEELDTVAGGAGGSIPLAAVKAYLVNFKRAFSFSFGVERE